MINSYIFIIVVVLLAAVILYLTLAILRERKLHAASGGEKESQLELLRAQINAYFLSKSLNKIYHLLYAGAGSSEAKQKVHAKVLHYILEECEHPVVPLKTEIDYLNNYLSLLQLGHEGKIQVEFQVEGDPSGITLPSLVFAPFFENALFHSDAEHQENAWLKSILLIRPDRLQFTITNSYDSNAQHGVSSREIIGRIRQRLELLYGEAHELEIIAGSSDYTTRLSLPR